MRYMSNDRANKPGQHSESQESPQKTKKQPLLAFGLWRADNQERYERIYPNRLPFEIVTKMKNEWRHQTSAKIKESYYAKEQELRRQRENGSLQAEQHRIEISRREAEVVQRVFGTAQREVESPKPDEYVKRPLNPFMIFCKNRRAELAISEPGLHCSEISKRLGAEWANMSADKKKPFYDEAGKLKQQVNEEFHLHPNYKFHPRKRTATQMSEGTSSSFGLSDSQLSSPMRQRSFNMTSQPSTSSYASSNFHPPTPMPRDHSNMVPQPISAPRAPSTIPTNNAPRAQQDISFSPRIEYPRTSGRPIRRGQENYGVRDLPVWF
ncbi:hypothetical protein L5515_015317 [Caenorhabditis briggsae]|uniref:Sex-determining region Y protein n=1 Tax=Caenorhabditis briggsae TaxID=6238 RepID=A0AAE9EBJ7_CAEBR|nr:hypothetical protein L5515_015317 [Caenorhabditis briggsae]